MLTFGEVKNNDNDEINYLKSKIKYYNCNIKINEKNMCLDSNIIIMMR